MIYSDWLPPKVVEEAKEKEKQRFAAAVAVFKQAAAVAAAEAARGNPNAYAAVLGQLMDDIKTLVSTKTLFAPASIRTLVYTLYDVVLATAADIEVQVRGGELLNHVLRHHRHSQHLGLQLHWRPLYDMLRGLYDAAPLQVKGTFLEHVQQSTLFALVARARRFFNPGAASEIWSLLRPDLVFGDPMGTQTHLALGWLVLFFPTKQIPAAAPGQAQAWVGEWLGVWGRLVNCSYWDSHWMYLLARAVKDDWKGVVDWAPYVPQLYTHMLACFKVPVGTATAGCPSSISAPHRATVLFGTKLDQVDDQPKSAAKLAVHLLKQPQQPQQQATSNAAAEAAVATAASLEGALSLGLGPAGSSSGVSVQGILHSRQCAADSLAAALASEQQQQQGETAGDGVAMSAAVAAAADALDSLVQLLEQYCHPSNTGGWSGDLAVFLRHGVHYFMKVLGRQCGSAGWPGEQVIVAAAARRYVRAAVKLAARGQFSKRDALVSASCKALCHLSYVWPGAVLPLVLGRFQSALATATAMHQLPTSISALALCVRPLLLAGWHTKEESTQQVIAEAMMAVLPGIDANDEAKTAAVFQFYTAVLSSIPALHGAAEEEDAAPVYGSAEGGSSSMDGVEYGGGGAASAGNGNGRNAPVYRLPLYLDDWVDQVMERLFTLLGNLDTGPSHRGTDQQAKPELLLQSTHLGKDTMYHSFFQHLLLRLPPRLADHVLGLLGQFATERALPTVAHEASSMFRSASIARPAAAVELIVKPLVARITAQMPESGARSLSRATEDSLTWSLVLLGSSVGGLSPDVLAPLVPRLEQLVDDALKLPSRVAHNWASMVLSSMLGVLSCWYVPDRAWPQQGGLLLPNGLQLWVDRQGVGWSAPTWALPSDEHTAIAARIAEKYLEEGARQLTQLCSSSSSSSAGATPSATAAAASDPAGSNGGQGSDQVDALAFKTQCRGLLASMAAVVIGLMSRLRDFEGFVAPSAADEAAAAAAAAAAAGGTEDAELAAAAANVLQVVGSCASPIGRPGVRNRVAAALTLAIKHLQGGDRELLEQASYTSLLLMSPGMLEQAVGGQGRSGGKDDGAITDEPAAATAYLLAWGSSSSSENAVAGPLSSSTAAAAAEGGFVGALMKEEARVHEEAAAARAAAAAGTEDDVAATATSSSSSRPAAGSWGSEWRWRRRSSPMAVIDRLRRMLLWRCAQAAAKAAPPVSPNSKLVSPSEAAAGSATPAGAVRLQQLPQEYLELFLELLSLSIQPNAGVRGSAVPTLLACLKRFPCLVELLVPEVLAALAGVPGPVLGAAAAGKAAAGLGGSSLPAAAAAGSVDGSSGAGAQAVQLPQQEALERFYSVVLLDAMRNQQADASAAPAAAAAGGSGSEDAAASGAQPAPVAAATMLAAAVKAAKATAAPGDGSSSTAAAAKAAAATAAALAAAGAGRSSVAQESVNDGRVAGACTVLTGCLDAWRVIFRDSLVFRGFLYALMASRCHNSNTCLKSIQMLIMQVISRFKLPPLLAVDGQDYSHLQASLMALAEPGARVNWRYSVLSNMVIMFAAPPAAAASSVPLLRHCLALLRSDMLLLRQLGGSGLWLLMAQMAAGSAAGNEALLAELKQALSEPGLGEQLLKLLVLDHAKLDASEAAKGSRGSGGGLGGSGGMLSGLLGMTAEEVLAAVVSAAVEKFDRWPAEGGRPTATTEGLFEVSHARLVRLMALLCPAELTAALQQPLTSRLAAYPTPSGPQEKAEVAAVAESLAGLLAAAAPAAAAGGVDAGWAVALLRETLVGSSLEMSDAWSAALWYILDHLLSTVLDQQQQQQQQQQRSSGSGNSSNGGAVVVADAIEEEGVETLDASGGSAASPAAVMLQQVVSAIMSAVQGAAAAAGAGAGDTAAAAAAAVTTAAQGSGASTPGALPSDLKRLKYLIHCLPAIRRQGTLGNAYFSSIFAAPAASEVDLAADGSSQAAVAAAAAAAQISATPGLVEAVPAAVAAAGGGFRAQRRLPKPCRVFLAALMQEISSLVEVEQPTAIRECIGSLLGDLAGLFAAPADLMLPASAAAVDAAPCAGVDRSSGGGGGSGCSSPVEIEVPAAADAAGGEGGGEVLLLNSSVSGLRAQAALLLQQAVQRFAVHAAQLELLKNSGAGGGGGGNISASNSSSNLQQQQRTSDNSDDAVMVDAADAAAAGNGQQQQQQRGSSSGNGSRLGSASPDSLAQSLTHCGVGLQMLIAAIESGETGSLRPLLAAMLPGVLQLQELSGPGLQQLSGEAKAAFVLYKYARFGALHVKGVAGAVLGAGGSEAWSSRAAAMVFLQVFWFRHCYQLDTADMEQLQAFVVGRLQDSKVEVRSLSAATLSGIIKALPAHEMDSLRRTMLASTRRLFNTPSSTRGKRSSSGSGSGGLPVVAASTAVSGVPLDAAGAAAFAQQQGPVFLAEAQAVVQGLKAFVLSSPYDVPAWMPDVLMALVAAANSRNPLVRRDASKALSEFKRTHEEDALEQLRGMLGEERWEAMAQVTSSASYFV